MNTLRRHGVHVEIIGRPVDLLTKWAGLWQPLECKPVGWNGKWSKKQKDQERYVKEHGVPVVTTPEEALRALGVL